MRFIGVLVTLFPVWAAASSTSSQLIYCVGANQSATLEIESSAGRKTVYLDIVDEGAKYSGELDIKKTDLNQGTIIYSQSSGLMSATVPIRWLNREFDRFSKADKNGYQISEQTRFAYSVNGNEQSITVSECESGRE